LYVNVAGIGIVEQKLPRKKQGDGREGKKKKEVKGKEGWNPPTMSQSNFDHCQ